MKLNIVYRGYNNLDLPYNPMSLKFDMIDYQKIDLEITENMPINFFKTHISCYLWNKLNTSEDNLEKICRNCFNETMGDQKCKTCQLLKKHNFNTLPPFPEFLMLTNDKDDFMEDITMDKLKDGDTIYLFFIYNIGIANYDKEDEIRTFTRNILRTRVKSIELSDFQYYGEINNTIGENLIDEFAKNCNDFENFKDLYKKIPDNEGVEYDITMEVQHNIKDANFDYFSLFHSLPINDNIQRIEYYLANKRLMEKGNQRYDLYLMRISEDETYQDLKDKYNYKPKFSILYVFDNEKEDKKDYVRIVLGKKMIFNIHLTTLKYSSFMKKMKKYIDKLNVLFKDIIYDSIFSVNNEDVEFDDVKFNLDEVMILEFHKIITSKYQTKQFINITLKEIRDNSLFKIEDIIEKRKTNINMILYPDITNLMKIQTLIKDLRNKYKDENEILNTDQLKAIINKNNEAVEGIKKEEIIDVINRYKSDVQRFLLKKRNMKLPYYLKLNSNSSKYKIILTVFNILRIHDIVAVNNLLIKIVNHFDKTMEMSDEFKFAYPDDKIKTKDLYPSRYDKEYEGDGKKDKKGKKDQNIPLRFYKSTFMNEFFNTKRQPNRFLPKKEKPNNLMNPNLGFLVDQEMYTHYQDTSKENLFYFMNEYYLNNFNKTRLNNVWLGFKKTLMNNGKQEEEIWEKWNNEKLSEDKIEKYQFIGENIKEDKYEYKISEKFKQIEQKISERLGKYITEKFGIISDDKTRIGNSGSSLERENMKNDIIGLLSKKLNPYLEKERTDIRSNLEYIVYVNGLYRVKYVIYKVGMHLMLEELKQMDEIKYGKVLKQLDSYKIDYKLNSGDQSVFINYLENNLKMDVEGKSFEELLKKYSSRNTVILSDTAIKALANNGEYYYLMGNYERHNSVLKRQVTLYLVYKLFLKQQANTLLTKDKSLKKFMSQDCFNHYVYFEKNQIKEINKSTEGILLRNVIDTKTEKKSGKASNIYGLPKLFPWFKNFTEHEDLIKFLKKIYKNCDDFENLLSKYDNTNLYPTFIKFVTYNVILDCFQSELHKLCYHMPNLMNHVNLTNHEEFKNFVNKFNLKERMNKMGGEFEDNDIDILTDNHKGVLLEYLTYNFDDINIFDEYSSIQNEYFPKFYTFIANTGPTILKSKRPKGTQDWFVISPEYTNKEVGTKGETGTDIILYPKSKASGYNYYYEYLKKSDNDDRVLYKLMYHDYQNYINFHDNIGVKEQTKSLKVEKNIELMQKKLTLNIRKCYPKAENEAQKLFMNALIPNYVKYKTDKKYYIGTGLGTVSSYQPREIDSKIKILNKMFNNSDNLEYIMLRIEYTNCQLLDLILFQKVLLDNTFSKYKSDKNRILTQRNKLIKNINENLTDDMFNTLNNTLLKTKYKTIKNLCEKIKDLEESIDCNELIDLISLPGIIFNEPIDLFYFKKDNEKNIKNILPKHYHPDKYDRSHRQIFIYDNNIYTFLITPVKNKLDIETYKDYVSSNAKNILYGWLETYAKKEISDYMDYIGSFNPSYYEYSFKKIVSAVDEKYGIKTKTQIVNKFHKTVYYQFELTKSKEFHILGNKFGDLIDKDRYSKLIIPVIPYAFDYTSKHEYISEKYPDLGNVYETFINLTIINEIMPNDFYKPIELLVIDGYVTGIICQSDLVLTCEKIAYKDIENKIKLSPSTRIYILYDEINKQFFETHKNLLNNYEKLKVRDYLYNHLRYRIMKNPQLIYSLDASSENVSKLENLLEIKKETDSSKKIFNDSELKYDVIMRNDYNKTIHIPNEYKEHIISRLIYDLEYVPLSLNDVQNNVLSSIPNMFLFRQREGEIFTVIKKGKDKKEEGIGKKVEEEEDVEEESEIDEDSDYDDDDDNDDESDNEMSEFEEEDETDQDDSDNYNDIDLSDVDISDLDENIKIPTMNDDSESEDNEDINEIIKKEPEKEQEKELENESDSESSGKEMDDEEIIKEINNIMEQNKNNITNLSKNQIRLMAEESMNVDLSDDKELINKTIDEWISKNFQPKKKETLKSKFKNEIIKLLEKNKERILKMETEKVYKKAMKVLIKMFGELNEEKTNYVKTTIDKWIKQQAN